MSAVPPRNEENEEGRLELFEGGEGSLLDLVDHLLNQGVVLTGDVVIGLANIDLIYLRLSVLLCAADRILPGRGEEA
jgi:hypothetical protein